MDVTYSRDDRPGSRAGETVAVQWLIGEEDEVYSLEAVDGSLALRGLVDEGDIVFADVDRSERLATVVELTLTPARDGEAFTAVGYVSIVLDDGLPFVTDMTACSR